MAKGRTRVKGATKGKRWVKGKSSSSNPETKKYRNAAKGRMGSHIAASDNNQGLPLTTQTLALHDRAGKQGLSSFPGATRSEQSVFELESLAPTASTAITSSSVYSLVETAHPVFGSVRKMWKNPGERSQSILATLAAISEVVKSNSSQESETEYFSLLLSSLDSTKEEDAAFPLAYLLRLIVPRVEEAVLRARCVSIAGVLSAKLVQFSDSADIDLLTSLLKALSTVLSAQDSSAWGSPAFQTPLHVLLMFSMHSEDKVRRAGRGAVVSLLREGSSASSPSSPTPHPAGPAVAKFVCDHVKGGSGREFGTLCLFDLLKDCVANFPTPQVKVVAEMVLTQMTVANSELKLSGLRVLNGLFTSVSGPNGLTAMLNGKLITALYSYQPSLEDAQYLKTWLQVLRAANVRLYSLDRSLSSSHLPVLISCCMQALLASGRAVWAAATDVMTTAIKECLSDSDTTQAVAMTTASTAAEVFSCILKGLRYKYNQAWPEVFAVLRQFIQHQGAGPCRANIAKSLVSLAELRDLPNFRFKDQLDAVFGVAIETMGPKTVLSTVPLQLEEDRSFDFPKSWLLPLLREHTKNTELHFFLHNLMPMADRLAQKGEVLGKQGRSLEARLLLTLEGQLWDTLPGFCTSPTDLAQTFKQMAKMLGLVLKNRPSLRVITCTALCRLIQTNRGNESQTAQLSSFAKNYLPILFNLHTIPEQDSPDGQRAAVLACIAAFASISGQQLLQTLFTSALASLSSAGTSPAHLSEVLDLLLSLLPHLPAQCLQQLFLSVQPLVLSSPEPHAQKRGYQILHALLTADSAHSREFVRDKMADIQELMLAGAQRVLSGSDKPRLRCLLAVVRLVQEGDCRVFLASILPEAILGLKQTNERSREIAGKLVTEMAAAVMKTSPGVPAEDSLLQFLDSVLAGLAGSTLLISATITALTRLINEYHDMLSSERMGELLSSVTLLLRAKSREVVKAAISFVKVIIGVLPMDELLPHMEKLVRNLCDWKGSGNNYFRLKCQQTFEKLIRKTGYQTVLDAAPKAQTKFIVYAHKMAERKKKQRMKFHEDKEAESEGVIPSLKTKQRVPSAEQLLSDTSSEGEEEDHSQSLRRKGKAWIREEEQEPLDFLDRAVAKKILSSEPGIPGKRKRPAAFALEDGKLLIKDLAVESSTEQKDVSEEAAEQGDNGDDTGMDTNQAGSHGNKDRPSTQLPKYQGGGRGIHRVLPDKRRKVATDVGRSYKAKKAGGDLKTSGKLDPFAYLPLDREKLNRRKTRKLRGQYDNIMKSAKVGSLTGSKMAVKSRKLKKRQ